MYQKTLTVSKLGTDFKTVVKMLLYLSMLKNYL